MRCKALTKLGLPCTAPAQHASGFCFSHDPALADVRDAARKRGGAARRDQLRGAKIPTLMAATDVREYLCRVLRDTEAQLIPPNTARAIAALCKIQLEAVREAEMG